MKNLLLLISLFFSTQLMANNPLISEKQMIKNDYQSFYTKKRIGTDDLSNKIKALAKRNDENPKVVITPMKRVGDPIRKSDILKGDIYHRLDSLVGLDPNGNLYTKEEVEYANIHLDQKFIRYYWNSDANDWAIDSYEEYEWDNQERLISVAAYFLNYGFGEKYELIYDEDKDLVIEEISSFWNPETDWVYSERLVREFDNDDNPIFQIAYRWEDGEWINNVKRETEFDNEHREKKVKVWMWENESWVGDFMMEYEFDQWGHSSLIINSVWSYNANNWEYFKKTEQEFIAPRKISFQLIAFWNEAMQDWVGTEWFEVVKAEVTYDDQLREIQDIASTLVDYTTWVKSVAIETEYNDYVEGGFLSEAKTYFYDAEGEEREHKGTVLYEYDHLDRNTLIQEDHFDDWLGEWIPITKRTATYEGDNPEPLVTESWEGDGMGNLMPNIRITNTYDNDYKLLEFIAEGRDWSTDDPAWELSNWWKYEYDQGVQTRKYGWRYQNGNWVSNFGDGIDIDFTFDPMKMIFPLFFYDYYDFKVVKRYVFESISGSEDFDEFIITYYWSEQELPTNVTTIVDSQISVYPNPTQGMVHINTDEEVAVSVYNINGMQLLQTNEKQIDLSNFAPGMYIFDVNGHKTKIIRSK